MQPEIFSFNSPISRCRSREAKRREFPALHGMERAVATRNSRDPGTKMMSVNQVELAVASPISTSAS